MRVTSQMTTNSILANINRNLGLVDKYNTQGSTGKKIQAPSDDPIIASRALKYRTILAENAQYMKNSEQAKSWIDVTEGAIQNINSIAGKMKELMQQGASDTYSVNDRKKILTEFNSLVTQLEQEVNTTYMGRYVFSGFKTDTPPITNVNGKNVLNPEIFGQPPQQLPGQPPQPGQPSPIIGQDINLEIGTGSNITINSLAPTVYPGDFAIDMRKLGEAADFIGSQQYEALTEQDKVDFDKDLRTAMSTAITEITKFTENLSIEHTKVGVKIKKIDLVQNRLKNDETSYTELMSNNENIDLSEVMMNYNSASAAYQASLKIGMNINQLTLADYIR